MDTRSLGSCQNCRFTGKSRFQPVAEAGFHDLCHLQAAGELASIDRHRALGFIGYQAMTSG